MGKLKIRGKAAHEYESDLIELVIEFQAHEATAAESIKKALAQCESFLSFLKEEKIDINTIRIESDKVEQDFDDEKPDVCASRGIKLRFPFDMAFTNYIMTTIQEKKYSADVSIDYLLSDRFRINNELIKEAINDSKEKATFIASAMGQTIVGIDSVTIEDRYDNRMDYMCEERGRFVRPLKAFRHSNMLQAPVTEESAAVEVVWIIE